MTPTSEASFSALGVHAMVEPWGRARARVRGRVRGRGRSLVT